jgi:NitT/TauT family transport system ATP-binding protein
MTRERVGNDQGQVRTDSLVVRDISKTYGSGSRATRAVGSVSFTVHEKEFVSVVGPSGCGKTTLLKCISGLLAPTSGQALLGDQVVTQPPPHLAVVFQDYSRSLFPWLTARKNVMLPLRNKSRRERQGVAERSLEAVGLTGFGDHYPWQLSGGMQQRVAIARALAYEPRILVMDEPFASVDAQTRSELEDLVLRVGQQFGVSTLLVTHDIDEAVYMSDRVVILSGAPSTVRDVLDIDLPRPRDQIETKELPEFARLRAYVYRTIVRSHSDPQQNAQ